MRHLLPIAILLFAITTACGKEKKSDADDVAWPEKPADGSPIAIEFLSLKGEGEDVSAEMRVFNFADQDITGLSGLLRYLDDSGAELKDFPWSQKSAGAIAKAKGHGIIEVGAFIPEGTTSVSFEIRRVELAGDETWERPE